MPGEPDRLIGESASFLQALDDVSAVAPLDKPVLVVGERGTGKELVARRACTTCRTGGTPSFSR